MYALENLVLGTLQADIAGGATSLIVQPMAGTAFNMPPAPTDAAAGTPTYGTPYGIVTLLDRLDSSLGKKEIMIYSGRAAAGGGAYTLSGLLRGQEGTSGQAWTAGAYVVQQSSADVLGMHMQRAVARSGLQMVHARTEIMTWDGTSFTFNRFRAMAIGNGKHFSASGWFDVDMPANAKVVKGYGGAADITVASGAIALPENSALWYEPNIGGGVASNGDNFRVTTYTATFAVPAHWIFIAFHGAMNIVGEKILRVCNGATLYSWQAPAFLNSWVNFGSSFANAGFKKGADQRVYLKGMIKSGTVATGSTGTAFTLAAGYRPASDLIFAAMSNDALGQVRVYNAGDVRMYAGNNTYFSLDGISFQAEA